VVAILSDYKLAIDDRAKLASQMLCFASVARRTCTRTTYAASFASIFTTGSPHHHDGARSIRLLQQLSHVQPKFSPDQPSSPIRLSRRSLQDLAPKPVTVQSLPSTTIQAPAAKELDNTAKDQRRNDWNIIKKLMVHVWPKQDWRTRGTVLLGFGLLVSGKVSGGEYYANDIGC
jgi:ATP-binding cassette, subfamily B (MDR/TAP), member 7